MILRAALTASVTLPVIAWSRSGVQGVDVDGGARHLLSETGDARDPVRLLKMDGRSLVTFMALATSTSPKGVPPKPSTFERIFIDEQGLRKVAPDLATTRYHERRVSSS